MASRKDLSEIAQLRRQIAAEYAAMRFAISGLSQGMASHDFIRARFKNVGTCCDRLETHVGEQEATTIMCELYSEIMQ